MSSLVSIITPAFNNASTLRETADSVFAQSYGNWEWIVVNNGSEDETDSILKELASDNRVNVVSLEKNLGVSGGRNAGLAQAAGDFLCFLDADDRLTPESLEARMKVMKTRPEVSFVDGGVRKIDPIGNELSLEQPRFERYTL